MYRVYRYTLPLCSSFIPRAAFRSKTSLRKREALQRPPAIPQRPFPSGMLQVSSALGGISHLQGDFGIHHLYLHGNHLRDDFILEEGSQAGEAGHAELCGEAVEQHPEEAVALGQRRVSGRARTRLQAQAHLRMRLAGLRARRLLHTWIS